MMAPDRFIPLAERTGLIVPLGEWALDEACRQMRIWRDAGHGDWTIAVNLSPQQFVRDARRHHKLEPACLILEITESTAMRDVELSLAVLRQLRETGAQIAIDDFGTGYSSLLYLKRLPATELKIDRGFIRDLVRGTEDSAIVGRCASSRRASRRRRSARF